MSELYTLQRFLLMTLDPVHIGTGGYRLGRADLSIVREPGTNLPKIPGTSLSGAARSYAAMRYGKIQCAGQKDHCGEPTCPICYTFGSIRGSGGGNAGTVSISDARLLLFPVHSMVGPVWVTSPMALKDFGLDLGLDLSVSEDKARWANGLSPNQYLNFGWLMLERESAWSLPDLTKVPAEIRERIVLVSDKLFSHIVNSNLEVRTSVSIDPKTGAAEEGALFTYEALPRAAFLWCDVVEDDYRKAFPKNDSKSQQFGHTRPLDVVKAGFDLAEYLGIGGMGTRGFGRVRFTEVDHAKS